MSNQAIRIASVNALLVNNKISSWEAMRRIFAIRQEYETKVEEIITNQNTDVIK